MDYERELKPIYIDSIEANQIYIKEYADKHEGQKIEFKIGKEWVEFNGISRRKAVLNDSLFLRYMRKSITRNSGDTSKDFIVIKFNYNVQVKCDSKETRIDVHELRELYYEKGITLHYEEKKKGKEKIEQYSIHYKMLMRSPGKAKAGECIFIRDNLYHKAIHYLTMGLYEKIKDNSEEAIDIVALSAYQTLATATAIDYIQIPLENILVIEDESVYTEAMKAVIVKDIECDSKKICTVIEKEDAQIENVLWDGMGLIDESIFPCNAEGFIYCRSHFFKSCLFRGSIQEYFKDWCIAHNKDYESYVVTDMFGNKRNLASIQVVITDKSIKWLKFIDLMGSTKEKAYKMYRKWMRKQEDCFSIVKTAHSSKWGEYQLSAYQMNNSLPTTDREVLRQIALESIEYCNLLKASDDEYLHYLDMKKDYSSINELLIELVKRNPDFVKCDLYRKKKTKDISRLKSSFKEGRLLQKGDNLTIMGNPIALLMKAVGDIAVNENIFEIKKDGIECHTLRFENGERLAAFRSPHNSPNNIVHFYNVHSEILKRYFPDIGKNVIIVNGIGTDIQARLNGMDMDSDFVYVTNQKDLADLACKAYTGYSTIINDVSEGEKNKYQYILEDFAKMDNSIADAQVSIGMSTDTAQLALSYYYDGDMENDDLKKCFIILSVLGQISIDLAKKTFDINVVKEIQRIKSLPCMKSGSVPKFFADTKKRRNDKIYEESKIKVMNCPMDIMSKMIDDNVKYSPNREKHLPITVFLENGKTKENRYKKCKVLEDAKKYVSEIKFLELENIKDSTRYQLKNKALQNFFDKTAKNLDEDTIRSLLVEANEKENSEYQSTIYNFLYRKYKQKTLDRFV